MDSLERAELAVKDLEPLLAAAGSIGPDRRRKKYGGGESPGNRMWISVPGGQKYPEGFEVTFERMLPLSRWEAGILEPYGRALHDLRSLPMIGAASAVQDVVLRAIAVQLGGERARILREAIRFLFLCSVSRYEGQPIHLNLLVDLEETARAAFKSLEDFGGHEWHSLLGSGLETGIALNRRGGIVKVEELGEETATSGARNALRPDAFRRIGDWAAGDARVALSLARTGDLLIHQGQILRYIYRSGRWRGVPVAVALRQSWCDGARIGPDLKNAVIASVMDASIGHHGACLAIVVKGARTGFDNAGLIEAGDRWHSNVKSRLYAHDRFPDLSRRQRLELLSIDGATVLDHTGRILAAGAIVEVPAGSRGGGRLAATRSLARYGAAFKVSQDGPVTLYGRANAGDPEVRLRFA